MAGTTDQMKGKVKQAAGDLTGDEETRNEGRVDEAKGDIKEKVGDVKNAVEGAIDKVADKLKR